MLIASFNQVFNVNLTGMTLCLLEMQKNDLLLQQDDECGIDTT